MFAANTKTYKTGLYHDPSDALSSENSTAKRNADVALLRLIEETLPDCVCAMKGTPEKNYPGNSGTHAEAFDDGIEDPNRIGSGLRDVD